MQITKPPTNSQVSLNYKIYHSQIASHHINYSIYTLFEYKTKQIFFYKIINLPPSQAQLIQSIHFKRCQTYQHIQQVRNDKLSLASRLFSSRLNIAVQNKIGQQNQKLITIKQPYIKGMNLPQMLVEFNHSKDKSVKEMHSFLQNLIMQLINLFIRVKKQALFIPTFRTIIFDKAKNQINLNLFSFVGITIRQYQIAIDQNELRQVLPFLDQSIFQQRQCDQQEYNWINLPRALAVIILGVLCGKETNLITTKDGPIKSINKSQLKQLVKRSSQKYKKMLSSKYVMNKLSHFQKDSGLSVRQFMQRVLVDEQMMSWSECYEQLYKSKRLIIKQIDKHIQNTAKRLWNQWRNKQDERLYYINNNILTLKNKQQPITLKHDCQMLLIIHHKLDFNLINTYGSIAELIHQTHNKQSSTFNSTITYTVYSLLNPCQQELGYDIECYSQQSRHKQCSNQENKNITIDKSCQSDSTISIMLDASIHNEIAGQFLSQSKIVSSQQIVNQHNKQEDESNQSIEMLIYQQQIHKFMHQQNIVKLESRWLKTLKDYERIVID